jgi:hypothetical protein
MTWEEFKGPFLKHHCPPAVINRIKEEFLQLRQRRETIDKITGVFLDKMKFCGELVKTEESRIYYYHNMLGAEYREFITPSKFETLSEIINASREREVELKKQIERDERRANPVNQSPAKKSRPSEVPRKGDGKSGAPRCNNAGVTILVNVTTKIGRARIATKWGTLFQIVLSRYLCATTIINLGIDMSSAQNRKRRLRKAV